MQINHNTFKDNHEGLAAKEFLDWYNRSFQTHYALIAKPSNVEPDFHAIDKDSSNKLQFEVTLGTSRQWIDEWKKILFDKKRSDLAHDILPRGELQACLDNIRKKLKKNYGENCALVVYYFSPSTAECFLEELRRNLDLSKSPFDRGIWLVCTSEFHRIDSEKYNQTLQLRPTCGGPS